MAVLCVRGAPPPLVVGAFSLFLYAIWHWLCWPTVSFLTIKTWHALTVILDFVVRKSWNGMGVGVCSQITSHCPTRVACIYKPYMLSTMKDEYVHTIDHVPYSKCVQEILGKTL